ncbi:MAG: O-antigen ligase family protein [Syntrophomonadaceae bacterium]|nr:O-antigen ligase family protein [Syntrophomonadaceae bacterium]
MGKKKKQSKQILLENHGVDNTLSWFLLLTILIVPLFLRLKVTYFLVPTLNAGVSSGFKPETTYYKAIILITIALFMLGIFFYKLWRTGYKLPASRINPILLILSLLILLSLLTADYKTISLLGNFDFREGTMVTLSCLFIFFIASQITLPNKFIEKLNIVLASIVLINFSLAFFNHYGIDIFQNTIVKSLLIPYKLRTEMQIEINGPLSSTIGNPNFVSGLFSALTCYFMVFSLLNKDWSRKLLYGLLSLISIGILLFAYSSSGLLALVVTSPIIVILFLMHLDRKSIIISTITIVSAIILITIFTLNSPVVNQAITAPFKELPNMLTYSSQTAKISEQLGPLELPPSGRAPGSGRLYIWSETLKLSIQKPLLGYGADTLLYYFPQYEPLKRTHLISYNVGVDKPHNYYLFFAYSFGFPALALLVLLLSLILIKTGKATIISNMGKYNLFLSAVLVFLIAYLTQWFFNDSVVGSAVIFWALAGLSFGIVQQGSNKQP